MVRRYRLPGLSNKGRALAGYWWGARASHLQVCHQIFSCILAANTIHTRIDRIYSQLYNSPWHCNTVKEDPTLYTGSAASDHLPVVATFDTPGARAPSKHDAKIDTNMFRTKSIRSGVQLIWDNTYAQLPPEVHGHALPWMQAKATTAQFLLSESNARRRAANPTTSIINKIKIAHTLQEQQGPTPTSVDRIKELHQQLKETKNKQAQNAYTAHARTLKEEKSTKEFYQPFKAKHASGDIPEILHTPNWNSPEAKFGTVDTTPQILGEFRGYYSWLTAANETLLRRRPRATGPKRQTHPRLRSPRYRRPLPP
eukprot:scaffold14707_cov129-Isochrysis_galbana.AAC.1